MTDLTVMPLPALAATLSAALDAHFDPAARQVRQVLALCEEAGELAEAYTAWRLAMVGRAPAGVLSRLWAEVSAELADVTITVYVTAHALGIGLPATVEPRRDAPLALTEEGHVLAVCSAAAGVAATWRRYAGMARRRGDWPSVAFALTEVHAWICRATLVLDVDLPDAVARKAAVILSRGWREPAAPPAAASHGERAR